MKIICNFKDYYDHILSYLPEPIYQREQKEFYLSDICKDLKDKKLKLCIQGYRNFLELDEKFDIVDAFADIEILEIAGDIKMLFLHFGDIYFLEDFIKILKAEKPQNRYKKALLSILEEFEKKAEKISEKFKEWFYILQAPLFWMYFKRRRINEKIKDDVKILINFQLKRYAFKGLTKRYPADVLSQKISNFLSYELASCKVVDFTGDDETRAFAKGFDRYSFRNPKTKKTPKKYYLLVG